MASSVILSDNGVTSGTQGVKTIAAMILFWKR